MSYADFRYSVYAKCDCKDCKNRYVKEVEGKIVSCRTTCESYKKFKTELEHNRNVVAKEKFLTSLAIEGALSNKKRRKRYERR